MKRGELCKLKSTADYTKNKIMFVFATIQESTNTVICTIPQQPTISWLMEVQEFSETYEKV